MKIQRKKGQAGLPLVKAFSVLLILALCVGALPLPASAASPASPNLVTCKFKHTVEAGDTLIYLGQLYNIDWREIAKANNIKEPYVLTAGTELCIPGGTKPSDTTDTTTGKKKVEPTLTASISGLHLLVTVENFPSKTNYYVRVVPRSFPVSYKVGHFLTNKEGDFTGWFKVPLFVPRSPDMAVCVKNVYTDSVSCVKFEDEYLPVVLAAIKCNKEGR